MMSQPFVIDKARKKLLMRVFDNVRLMQHSPVIERVRITGRSGCQIVGVTFDSQIGPNILLGQSPDLAERKWISMLHGHEEPRPVDTLLIGEFIELSIQQEAMNSGGF